MFGRATITLGIGPHSSFFVNLLFLYVAYVAVYNYTADLYHTIHCNDLHLDVCDV